MVSLVSAQEEEDQQVAIPAETTHGLGGEPDRVPPSRAATAAANKTRTRCDTAGRAPGPSQVRESSEEGRPYSPSVPTQPD